MSFSLVCRRETLLKKRLLHRCFPIKLSEHLFHRRPVNSLTTLTILFNFVENIWNFGAWSNLKMYLEYIARESCFPKILFLEMDRIFKTGLLSLEKHCGLLVPNIIVIFKNNVTKKTKIHSIKDIWTAAAVFSQTDTFMAAGCSGSEIAVKQILNLDHRLYSLQIYVICKSQVEIRRTFISLNLADFTDVF